VESIQRDATTGVVTDMQLRLHLAGNPKLTKKKVTWLSPTQERPLVPVMLQDFDYLINKKKLEEDDNIADHLTEVTEFREAALADHNVHTLAKGDIIQLERRGYYIVDQAYDASNPATNPIQLIAIPDGKAVNMASKAGVKAVVVTTITTVTATATVVVETADLSDKKSVDALGATLPARGGSMYTTQAVYGDLDLPAPDQACNMFTVKKTC
jgi:glutamyl-tRNA synthetase